MTHCTFVKTMHGPACGDPQTQEVFDRLRMGEAMHGDFRKMRNPKFHRKFFALLNLAFDYWEPGEINSKYGKPEKNFDRFRKDAIILAGFYHIVARLDGSTRVEADSISFAKMDDDEFSKVYNGVLDVFLKRIPQIAKMGEDEVNRIVDQLIAFG